VPQQAGDARYVVSQLGLDQRDAVLQVILPGLGLVLAHATARSRWLASHTFRHGRQSASSTWSLPAQGSGLPHPGHLITAMR
jgi:hypothetical protein